MMKLKLALILGTALALALAVAGQGDEPAPTLVVPTLVPQPTLSSVQGSFDSRSAIADIVASDSFRVGVLYNDPPYSALNLQGELDGFDIALLRLIAELWDVELVLSQVTRQNALDRLYSREVDAVASAFVRYRPHDEQVEFSQTYLTGGQALMVRADSAFVSPPALAGSRLGYVIGTRSEDALRLWERQLGVSLQSQFYLTLDRAFGALTNGEVEAVIGEEQDLLRVTSPYPGTVKILDEPVLIEPHAFSLRRQDANMRNLLNRSLQFLASDGRLDDLYNAYFPGKGFSADIIGLWEGIGEAPRPIEYSTEMDTPAQYTIPRLVQSGRIRVGGLAEENPALSESQRRVDALNRGMIAEIARRWGIDVEIIAGDAGSALQQLRNGDIDLVVGLRPDWQLAGELDFAGFYLLHGDRLMVPANSRIQSFNELRGGWIGVLFDDDTARDRAQTWADSINASVNFIHTPAASAALTILELDNADAIYADSLALIPHLEANPNTLRLTERWYSRSYIGFGLPYNDADLRLLIEYSVSELIQDGTLQRLSSSLLSTDGMTPYMVIPGEPTFAEFDLSDA